MAMMKQLAIIAGLSVLAGVGGYGAGLALPEGDKEKHSEVVESSTEAEASVPSDQTLAVEQSDGDENSPLIVSIGQFTVPIFANDRPQAVLLAQMKIQVGNYDQVRELTRQTAQVRSQVIETLFALERAGEVSLGAIDPKVIADSVRADLDSPGYAGVQTVLFDRLLVQESARAAR